MNGGIIGKDNVPTKLVATGIFDLDDIYNYNKIGVWPLLVEAPVQ